MAHRIYIYNVDFKTNERFSSYLAEWKYEIPALMLPLFTSNIRSKGTQLYADKQDGIARLRYFFVLLADQYQLHYKKQYYEPVDRMFAFLENLPFDTFCVDGRDVFNMNEEKHTLQAHAWAEEIKANGLLYAQAVEQRSLDPLLPILQNSGYASFLEMLQTDWINYGLGLWEEDVLVGRGPEVFEENGKHGLKDANGELLLPAVYEEIFEFNEAGVAVVQQDQLFGYINDLGVELVPCQYVEAFDARYINGINYSEVEVMGKWGLLHVEGNRLCIPAAYDELSWLTYGYLNAMRGEQNFLFSAKGTLVVGEPATSPFNYDYHKLFYCRQKGSMKRKYFRMDGKYLGEFLEDSLLPLFNGYFWIKPNKLQKKIAIIKPDGAILDNDIDRIVTLDDYRSVAYLKEKGWFVLSLKHHDYRLRDLQINKVLIDSIQQYRKDIFIIVSPMGQGIYDAYHDHWLLSPDPNYQKIEHCFLEFMRIQQADGMFYYDTKVNVRGELYDYICAPFYYPKVEDNEAALLLLFKGTQLFYLNPARHPVEIPETAFGRLYEERYSLQGHDQSYFIAFYQRWTKQKGVGYESYFDNETLYEQGQRFYDTQNIKDAIRLLTIGASRGSADCQYVLGNIYTDADYEETLDIARGRQFYEQAMKQDHAKAWTNWGFLHATGFGVELNIEQAIKAYSRAAELGEPQALSNLGNLYFDDEHVEQDYARALSYFKQAEKGGIANYAQMAEIYFQQQDYSNLIRCLKKDEAGQYAAIYYGILYEEGLGVKQSISKALKYYEQANNDAVYAYAVNRLLYYYHTGSSFANSEKYAFWLNFAAENNVDVEK